MPQAEEHMYRIVETAKKGRWNENALRMPEAEERMYRIVETAEKGRWNENTRRTDTGSC
jgi:RNA:NAD 2'-phosphotransferase (TPT1/KptA family)